MYLPLCLTKSWQQFQIRSSNTKYIHNTSSKQMVNSIAILVALSAITIHLIQTYIPPAEVVFVSCISGFCLLFGAAVGDPETFFGILFSIAPIAKKHMLSTIKSIEYLREGEKRCTSMEKNNKKRRFLILIILLISKRHLNKSNGVKINGYKY